MKIQEHIINEKNGIEYWNIFFEIQNHRKLSLYEWESINNTINKMVYDFNK